MGSQTPQQKLNSLYAELGLNLRDNDSSSPEMQQAAMAKARRVHSTIPPTRIAEMRQMPETVAPMTDERLTEIEARITAATPGPWIDLMRTYFERCKADRRQHGNRWYHGSERDSTPLTLIVRDDVKGERIDPEDIPRRVDKYEMTDIISLFWSSLPRRTTTMIEGFFKPEDAAFIVAARQDVPDLLAEVRRLRREVHLLNLSRGVPSVLVGAD